MTKTEFNTGVSKAGIPAELYGAILADQFPSNYGYVSGGKVTGIEWLDGWKTEQEYSCFLGTQTKDFLSKAPYVVLTKNRVKYLVEAWRIKVHVDKLLRRWLSEKAKTKELLKAT